MTQVTETTATETTEVAAAEVVLTPLQKVIKIAQDLGKNESKRVKMAEKGAPLKAEVQGLNAKVAEFTNKVLDGEASAEDLKELQKSQKKAVGDLSRHNQKARGLVHEADELVNQLIAAAGELRPSEVEEVPAAE